MYTHTLKLTAEEFKESSLTKNNSQMQYIQSMWIKSVQTDWIKNPFVKKVQDEHSSIHSSIHPPSWSQGAVTEQGIPDPIVLPG